MYYEQRKYRVSILIKAYNLLSLSLFSPTHDSLLTWAYEEDPLEVCLSHMSAKKNEAYK